MNVRGEESPPGGKGVRASGRDEVFAWRAPLDRSAPELAAWSALLSAAERERAERFHFERDRRHFIAARAMLRTLLGAYTGVAAENLAFLYGPQGKPSLASAAGVDPRLRFNVSHSNGVALFAFASGASVGVDIEFMRSGVDCTGIAINYFSPRERAVLERLPAPVQIDAFFACWTRKEAYIKALGGGLSVPLDRFDVSLSPEEPARLLEDRGDPSATQRWAMYDLDAGKEFRAALVVERPGATLRFSEWGASWPRPFE